jgi:hypothetical protein
MTGEKLMPLHTAVSKATGWNGNPSTIYKWWRDGVGGVRLEATYMGRRLFTSVEAVQRFQSAVGKKRERARENKHGSIIS